MEICRKEREEKKEEWQNTVMIMEERGHNKYEPFYLHISILKENTMKSFFMYLHFVSNFS
jgi:hypothetical protein